MVFDVSNEGDEMLERMQFYIVVNIVGTYFIILRIWQLRGQMIALIPVHYLRLPNFEF